MAKSNNFDGGAIAISVKQMYSIIKAKNSICFIK